MSISTMWTGERPRAEIHASPSFGMPAYGAFGILGTVPVSAAAGEKSALSGSADMVTGTTLAGVVVGDFPGTPAWRPPDW